MVSDIDFLTRQLSTTVLLSVFYHIHSFLIFASAHAFFSSRFCSVTLFVSFCSVFHTCAATLYQALHIRKRGKKALSDPLCFHFPRFLGRTDSIAACWWGWQWHLRCVSLYIPLLYASVTSLHSLQNFVQFPFLYSKKSTFLVKLEIIILCGKTCKLLRLGCQADTQGKYYICMQFISTHDRTKYKLNTLSQEGWSILDITGLPLKSVCSLIFQ